MTDTRNRVRVTVGGSSPLMDHLMALPARQRAAELLFLAEIGRRLLPGVGQAPGSGVAPPRAALAPPTAAPDWLEGVED